MTPEEQKRQQAQFRDMRPADKAAAGPAPAQTPAPAGPPQKAMPPAQPKPAQTPIARAAAGGINWPTPAERAVSGAKLSFRAQPRRQQTPLEPMAAKQALQPAAPTQQAFPSAAGATGSSTQQAMNFGSPGTTTSNQGGTRGTVAGVGQTQRPLVGLAPVEGEATPAVIPSDDRGDQIDAIIEDLLADEADTAAERAALEAQYEADRGRQLVDARAAGGLAGLGLSGGQQLLEGDLANAAMRQQAIGLGDFDRAQRTEDLARQQLALGALSDREMRDLYLEVYGEERDAQREDEAEADKAEDLADFRAGLEGFAEGPLAFTAGDPGTDGNPYKITDAQAAAQGLTKVGNGQGPQGGELWRDEDGVFYATPPKGIFG